MFLHLAVFNSLSPHTLLVSYYLLCMCFSESVSSSQVLSSPVVRFLSRCNLTLRSLFGCHLSCPAQACPINLTEGNGRCRKRQQTEAQTCIKLEPGRLGARVETLQPPPPPVSLLYTVATGGGEAILRREGVTL
jgi:hypothetical protein